MDEGTDNEIEKRTEKENADGKKSVRDRDWNRKEGRDWLVALI